MSEAIKEQTTGITQINEAISNIDALTKQNVRVAEDTNTVTNEVEEISRSIVTEVQKKRF